VRVDDETFGRLMSSALGAILARYR
jgi:hypothetical protein